MCSFKMHRTYLGIRDVLHCRRRKETEILRKQIHQYHVLSKIADILTSTEFTDNKRAIEVWLIAVPKVGWGGLVGP
jgi:hypothetical protein